MVELHSMRRRLVTTLMTKIMCQQNISDEKNNTSASYNNLKCFLCDKCDHKKYQCKKFVNKKWCDTIYYKMKKCPNHTSEKPKWPPNQNIYKYFREQLRVMMTRFFRALTNRVVFTRMSKS